jgi:hypothetical protein
MAGSPISDDHPFKVLVYYWLTYHNKRNKVNKAELISQCVIELNKKSMINYGKKMVILLLAEPL